MIESKMLSANVLYCVDSDVSCKLKIQAFQNIIMIMVIV